MLYRTFLLALFGFAAISSAQAIEPFAGPQPIAVLLQENPSAAVMGAETPRIAIYQNGDVIYSRGYGDDQTYLYAEMSFTALAAVTDHLMPVANLDKLKSQYSVTNAAGQGAALFYLHVNGKDVVTSVYGLRPEDDNGGSKARSLDKIPVELRQLYHYLLTVDFSETRPWSSIYVEAMIFPVDDASGGLLHWPKDWPDLKSDRAIKRKDGYSIFLNDSMRGDLKEFLAGEKKDGVVEIDGAKWNVESRPVFPSEPVWRKAFSTFEGK
jgi:hypothetical protein